MTALVPGSFEDATQEPIRTVGTASPTLAAVLKPGFFATGPCWAADSEKDLVPYVSRPWLSRLNEDDLIGTPPSKRDLGRRTTRHRDPPAQ